jgi:signal transduction histidine kinase
LSYAALWSLLTALSAVLVATFGYMFYKDKDKRKLIFALAFAFAAPSHIMMDNGWETTQTTEGIFWGVIPITAAFLIVSMSSALNIKDFDKPFKAFLIILIASTVLMFIPIFPVKTTLPSVVQIITVAATVASTFVYIKKRETSNLMFLLAMLCFSSGGVGIGIGLESYFSTFSFAFAYVFIGLVFITSKENMNEDVAHYFTLQEELQTTKEKLRESKEEQEQLVRAERLAAIGEAATMVGHDLRNPLQAIENATYYLNTELLKIQSSAAVMDSIRIIHKSIDYADNIVNDLLCFASTRKPVSTKTDINELIKETLLQINVPDNIETQTELDDLPKIEGDKQMLKRVFINLADNAVEAMEPKGGKLKVSTKQKDSSIEVKFEDTGAGIAEKNLQKIFAPFFTTKAQGMGVGLAICKRFVEQHYGTIKVESKEGEGSIFTIQLPISGDGGETA